MWGAVCGSYGKDEVSRRERATDERALVDDEVMRRSGWSDRRREWGWVVGVGVGEGEG